MKASNKASDKQVQHLVLTVCASGTHNLSTVLINEQLSSSIRANYSQVHVFHAKTHQLDYFTIFTRMEVHPHKMLKIPVMVTMVLNMVKGNHQVVGRKIFTGEDLRGQLRQLKLQALWLVCLKLLALIPILILNQMRMLKKTRTMMMTNH